MADYYAIPTHIGEAKLARALALGVPLEITHLAVGDGEGPGAQGTPLPDPAQTALRSERRRAPLNTLTTDPTNTNVLVAEQVIPEDIGGFWIREMGLIDADGDLIAVCNTPPTYKPVLASGSGRTQVVRMLIIVTDTSAVTLRVDPAVVLATRKYVDSRAAELVNAAVPGGIVTFWSGRADRVPTGWALCDGTQGTPDLRGMFIIGAGGDYEVGDTGGAATATTNSAGAHTHPVSVEVNAHTLTTAQMPSHSHPVSFRYDDGGGTNNIGGTKVHSSVTSTSTGATGGGGAHSHTASGSTTSSGAHTHTVNTLPPYYALAFIMKL